MAANRLEPIISRVCPDGALVETVYDPENASTALAVSRPECPPLLAPHFDLSNGTRLVPYSATNNLLTTGCVLLPSAIGEARDKGDLVDDIRAYLARYVELSPGFLDLAPYYVLLSWVYDAFNELPYLRFRGEWGTGKTRALITLGSICYKPFFASGASTVSPIFHILDGFRGTLVLDEADFRFSDMRGELVKVLNNGTVNGLPVLRTMTNRHRELNPQAFRVYGPKILAMRERFSDPALESRFITEETAKRPLPPHIPIHTPERLREEARELRNTLLSWRFAHRHAVAPDASRLMADADPRANQMAIALLSLVDDEAERSRITDWLGRERESRRRTILSTAEMRVLAATRYAFQAATGPYVPIAVIADRFNQTGRASGHAPMTNKWVGGVLRSRFAIPTAKSRGVYGISITERARVAALADRLGVQCTLTADDDLSPADAADSVASTKAR